VLRLVLRGLLNKQIAFELGSSEKTGKFHRGRVMAKREARSVAELVRQAAMIRIDPTLDTQVSSVVAGDGYLT
jgi:FixJ family two-component response regulator